MQKEFPKLVSATESKGYCLGAYQEFRAIAHENKKYMKLRDMAFVATAVDLTDKEDREMIINLAMRIKMLIRGWDCW